MRHILILLFIYRRYPKCLFFAALCITSLSIIIGLMMIASLVHKTWNSHSDLVFKVKQLFFLIKIIFPITFLL